MMPQRNDTTKVSNFRWNNYEAADMEALVRYIKQTTGKDVIPHAAVLAAKNCVMFFGYYITEVEAHWRTWPADPLVQVSINGDIHYNNREAVTKGEFIRLYGSKIIISKVVGQTFIDNPRGYPHIIHKDKNPRNNCKDNLEWSLNKPRFTYHCDGYCEPSAEKLAKKLGIKLADVLYSYEFGNTLGVLRTEL